MNIIYTTICNFLYSLLLFLSLHVSASKMVELYNGSVVLWIYFILPAMRYFCYSFLFYFAHWTYSQNNMANYDTILLTKNTG
jgi:hypothetical protein